MSKKTISFIIGILVIIVGVFAFINRQAIEDKKQDHEKMNIIIKKGEKETTFSHDEILEFGEEEFKANLKSSGKKAVEHIYTGVPLIKLLQSAEIEMKEEDQINVKSIDGYTVALRVDEVLDEENIYLSYKIDGELMKPREDGGDGPYQMIIRKDQFSQRWAKYVVEIEVN